MSPRRRYPRPLIYEQLVAERLFDPLDDKEPPVARHADYDGNGVLDHLEPHPDEPDPYTPTEQQEYACCGQPDDEEAAHGN